MWPQFRLPVKKSSCHTGAQTYTRLLQNSRTLAFCICQGIALYSRQGRDQFGAVFVTYVGDIELTNWRSVNRQGILSCHFDAICIKGEGCSFNKESSEVPRDDDTTVKFISVEL